MASASQIASSPVTKSSDLWKFGDAAVLLAYSCVVLWILPYHEKWADEAQAWLIARDLDLRTIWFHELRYEGSPGLWHTILWIAQHIFHATYSALGYIGAAFAIAGAAVLLFFAPFPLLHPLAPRLNLCHGLSVRCHRPALHSFAPFSFCCSNLF